MAQGISSPPIPFGEAELVRQELRNVAASAAFQQEERLTRFLTFVVDETVQGRASGLKESIIGIEVFDRSPGYDPKIDPIVRVQARRLRAKLDSYYLSAAPGPLRISLPKGGYVPEFSAAPPAEAPAIPAPDARQEPARRRPALYWVAAAGLLLGIGAGAVFLSSRRGGFASSPARTSRLFASYPGYQHTPAFSPDGRTIAFAWGGLEGGKGSIFVQGLAADTPRRLTSSPARDRRPIWLADGQSIGFVRDDGPNRFALMVVAVLGGGERRVATILSDSAWPPRVEWSRDGRKVYSSEREEPGSYQHIVEIDLESGGRRNVTPPQADSAASPGDDEATLSPDGRWVAFRRRSETSTGDVFVVSVNGDGLRRITHDNSGTLGHAWTPDGKALVVSSRKSGSLHRLWRFRLDGKEEPVCLTDAFEAASSPSINRGDGAIAYANRYLDTNIWRIGLKDSAAPERIIASNLLDTNPRYSPDGSRIAFRSNRTGNEEIWIGDGNGGSPARVTSFGGPVTGSARWSPDGQFLALDSRPHGNADVFVMPAGGGVPRQITSETSNEVVPSFSHDGTAVYFASDRTGAWQIWRQALNGGAPRQITRQHAFGAQESPDGRWLYYAKPSEEGLYRMPVSGGEEERVLPSLPAAFWGSWAFAGNRILYFAVRAGDKGLDPTELRMLDPATGKTWPVAVTQFPPVRWDGGLSVTPDGRYALIALLEREGSDIHLLTDR